MTENNETTEVAVICGDMNGTRLLFGLEMPGNLQDSEKASYVHGRMNQRCIPVVGVQHFMTVSLIFCPRCDAASSTNSEVCSGCGTPFQEMHASGELQQTHVRSTQKTVSRTIILGFEAPTYINAEGMIWSIVPQDSNLHKGWRSEEARISAEMARRRAEASGIVIATQAQATQAAKTLSAVNTDLRASKIVDFPR